MMKKLNKSTVAILAIVSTILSYPTWLLITILWGWFMPDVFGPTLRLAFDIATSTTICTILFWGCRILYRLYNRMENKRTIRWSQIGFIFLVSFGVKFIVNCIMVEFDLFTLTILYGVDIIFIAPIAIVINLLIATTPVRKPDKCTNAN